MSITAFYTELTKTLNTSLPAFMAPVETLPALPSGKVAQCAVIWATPGTGRMRANHRDVHERAEQFNIVCVGATALDALAAADKVRHAITGRVLTAQGKGMAVSEDLFTPPPPAIEPGTNPVRVTTTLQFRATTKEK